MCYSSYRFQIEYSLFYKNQSKTGKSKTLEKLAAKRLRALPFEIHQTSIIHIRVALNQNDFFTDSILMTCTCSEMIQSSHISSAHVEGRCNLITIPSEEFQIPASFDGNSRIEML